MTYKEKAEAYVREKLPELMELSFGCELKHNKIVYKFVNDWDKEDYGVYSKVLNLYSEIEDKTGGNYTAHVSDLEPETYKIIGHPIQLQHWLKVLDKKAIIYELCNDGVLFWDVDRSRVVKTILHFNLETGQLEGEVAYQTFCNIVGI